MAPAGPARIVEALGINLGRAKSRRLGAPLLLGRILIVNYTDSLSSLRLSSRPTSLSSRRSSARGDSRVLRSGSLSQF
eukprot:7124591-Prymnesium_polylepis.1